MEGGQRYKGSVVLALVALYLSLQTVSGQGNDDCVYEYIKQPPEEISCNPYGDGDTELNLECALTAPLGLTISINWFRNNSNQIDTGINSSMESGNTGVNTFQSVLSITNPNPETQSGDYFCQGAVDGMHLSPSDPFLLSDDTRLYINYAPCDGLTMISMDQFKMETKCADVTPTEIPTTVFVSTQPSTTPPPPITTPHPPVTTLPVTPSQTTTSFSTSQDVILSTTNQTAPIVTQQPTTNNIPSTTEPQAVPGDLQVWIYVLVGVAAVFGMIIVILTIMCVGLCLRRNKNTDSETLKRNGVGGHFTVGSSMVSNEMYHSTENNFSSPTRFPEYNTLGEREYEVIGFFDSKQQQQYSHLHRPSPPPLPNSLPNGRSATIGFSPPNGQFRSMSTLASEQMGEVGVAPHVAQSQGFSSTLPKLGNPPEHHVYRELENPSSLSNSPNDSSPPNSANAFERGDSSAQLLPGPLSKVQGGPYRKYSSDSTQSSNLHESLYSPTTPVGSFTASVLQHGLEDIPETGIMFAEPNDPTAFPVHEYEAIPTAAKKKKTSNYQSPVPDAEEQRRIGAKPQTRASVKSCNYETDPKMDQGLENTDDLSATGDAKVDFSLNSLSGDSSDQRLSTSSTELRGHNYYSNPHGVSDCDSRGDTGLKSFTMESNATVSSTSTHNFSEQYEPDYSAVNGVGYSDNEEDGTDGLESQNGPSALDPDFFKDASEIHLRERDASLSGNTNNHGNTNSESIPHDLDYHDHDISRRASSSNSSNFPTTTHLYPPQCNAHMYSKLALSSLPHVNGYPQYRVGSKTTV